MAEIVNPPGGGDIPHLGGFKYTWTEINPNEISEITDFLPTVNMTVTFTDDTTKTYTLYGEES